MELVEKKEPNPGEVVLLLDGDGYALGEVPWEWLRPEQQAAVKREKRGEKSWPWWCVPATPPKAAPEQNPLRVLVEQLQRELAEAREAARVVRKEAEEHGFRQAMAAVRGERYSAGVPMVLYAEAERMRETSRNEGFERGFRQALEAVVGWFAPSHNEVGADLIAKMDEATRMEFIKAHALVYSAIKKGSTQPAQLADRLCALLSRHCGETRWDGTPGPANGESAVATLERLLRELGRYRTHLGHELKRERDNAMRESSPEATPSAGPRGECGVEEARTLRPWPLPDDETPCSLHARDGFFLGCLKCDSDKNAKLRHLERLLSTERETVQRLGRDLEAQVQETELLRAEKDNAYRERNQILALLARMAQSLGWRVGTGQDPQGEPEWRTLLYVDLPTGQASWHFHDHEAHLLEGLELYPGKWDGHTTEQKYDRVNHALRGGVARVVPASPETVSFMQSIARDITENEQVSREALQARETRYVKTDGGIAALARKHGIDLVVVPEADEADAVPTVTPSTNSGA